MHDPNTSRNAGLYTNLPHPRAETSDPAQVFHLLGVLLLSKNRDHQTYLQPESYHLQR